MPENLPRAAAPEREEHRTEPLKPSDGGAPLRRTQVRSAHSPAFSTDICVRVCRAIRTPRCGFAVEKTWQQRCVQYASVENTTHPTGGTAGDDLRKSENNSSTCS